MIVLERYFKPKLYYETCFIGWVKKLHIIYASNPEL